MAHHDTLGVILGVVEKILKDLKSFSQRVSELKKGVSAPEIAKVLGFSTTTALRAQIHMDKEAAYGAQSAMAARLRAKGYSDSAIGRRMNISPNTVKNLLLTETKERHNVTQATKKKNSRRSR